jgi:hypothetical protein
MILEWVKVLGPILISWPVVGLITILVFRKPLLALADRFTGEDVQRVKFGSLELERVKVKVDQVEDRQALQAAEIKAIELALKGILTKYEKGHLEGLKRPEYKIQYEPDLYRYLHRLDGLNFIQPNLGYGLMTIEDRHRPDEKIPVEQRPFFDLKEFVSITEDGERYLDTWQYILKKIEEQRRGEDKGDGHF